MKKLIVLLIIVLLVFGGWYAWDRLQEAKAGESVTEPSEAGQSEAGQPGAEKTAALLKISGNTFDISGLPEYSGEPFITVNGGRPDFAEEDFRTAFSQSFSELDDLGRCGPAFACLDREHMPEGERGSIGMVRPSGWQISKYDFIDNGGYLYNRCHLIGWQLTGENAEVRNLITGTRYMNVEGMLRYENKVAGYIRFSGRHVLYRVTPVFCGGELVCRGVQIEAESVEDRGKALSFNVYCYNVQPGVEIDYLTGNNHLKGQ